MADLPASLKDWSLTEGANEPAGTRSIGNLDNNLRRIQTVIREEVATSDTLASASTTDLGSVDAHVLNITGTTTITSLGTVSAGIRRKVWFTGALTLTHNGTSLILPTASNITTAAGDSAEFLSLGSGNWRCLWFQRASAVLPASLSTGLFLTNNGTTTSWATPAASLSSLTAATTGSTLANGANLIAWNWTGLGSNQVAFSLGGQSLANNGTVLKLRGAESSGNNPNAILEVTGESTSAIFTINPASYTLQPPARTTPGGALTCTVGSGNATTNGAGGPLNIIAGNANGGFAGGTISLQPGTGSPAGAVIVRNAGDTLRIRVDSTTPTISSGGGAGATIRGIDNFFEVTFGTGSPTNVVVGFSTAKGTAPMVLISGTQAGQVLTYSASTSGITISSGTAFSSGTKVTCMVIEAS
jgi:hypothetical protein